MKTIFVSFVLLVFLASCTPIPEKPMDSPNKIIEKKEMMDDQMMSGADMMKKDAVILSSGALVEMNSMSGEDIMDDQMMKNDESKIIKPTGYMNYDKTKVEEALASGQKVVLFFHATWCPSCRSLDAAIRENLTSIPTDTLIVKTDYDASTDLKKEYRVTSQHTTVILDSDGTEKSRKLGARSIVEIFE